MKKILFVIIFICSFVPPVWAASVSYYISTSGSGTTCSSDTPCDLSYAVANAVSGDTIYFRSQDTWTGASPIVTATAGVTYDGSTYGTGTRASLSATGDYAGSYLDGGVFEINASNVTVKGFDVSGNNHKTHGITFGLYAVGDFSDFTIDNCIVHDIGNGTDVSTGIRITPMSTNFVPQTFSNVSILNTTVHDVKRYSGITLYATWTRDGAKLDTVLVRNCTVYNCGTDPDNVGGGIGVYVKGDADNITVEFCTLYANDYGVHVETSGDVTIGTPDNLTVRYNIVHDNVIGGFEFYNRNQTINGSYYGNILYDNGKAWTPYNYSADIMIGGEGDPTDYKTSVLNFYNNTIRAVNATTGSSNKYGLLIGAMDHAQVTGGTFNFKNNIVYSGNYPAIYDLSNILTHSNNLVYRTSGASDEHVNNGTSRNRAGVKTWEATAQNTDPTFTGGTLPTGFSGTYGVNMIPNTTYFAIASGDAIGTGATLGSPYNSAINYAGYATPLTRPAGAYDIGAYQYTGVGAYPASSGGKFIGGLLIQ